MQVKLQKWGNSMGIRIPAAILKELDLSEGDILETDIYNNTLRLRKTETLSINEMVAEYNGEDYPYSEFFDSEDVRGKELW